MTMKNTDHHPPTEDLVKLLSGELDPDRSSSVLSHAEGCERCQQLSELIWAEALPRRDPVPTEMDGVTAEALEKRLVARLHQANLAEKFLDLGSNGFVIVLLGLLRPVIHVFSVFSVQPPRNK